MEGLSFGEHSAYADIHIKVHEHNHELLAKGVRKVLEEELTQDGLPARGTGQLYGVIENRMMQKVKAKRLRGKYVYQRQAS